MVDKSTYSNNLDYCITRSGYSFDEVCEGADISRNYLYELRKGKKPLNARVAKKIADFLKIDSADLFAKPKSSFAEEAPAAYQHELIFIEVPAYDVTASAGGGANIESEPIKYMVRFRRDWLRKRTQASSKMLKIIGVHGDSMAPTLLDGDSVLLDMSQTDPRAEGIYAIRYDHSLIIKRVQYNPSKKTVTLVSDNKLYESMHDIDPATLDIVGRAIWQSRNL